MSRTILPSQELPSIGSLLSATASNKKGAQDIVKESLEAINGYDRQLNSLTAVINGNALEEAEELDVRLSYPRTRAALRVAVYY